MCCPGSKMGGKDPPGQDRDSPPGKPGPEPPPGQPDPHPPPPAAEAAEEPNILESQQSIDELLGALGIGDVDDDAAAQESQTIQEWQADADTQPALSASKSNRFKRAGSKAEVTAPASSPSSAQSAGASAELKGGSGEVLPPRGAEGTNGRGRRKCNVCMECYAKAEGYAKGAQWFRCRLCHATANCMEYNAQESEQKKIALQQLKNNKEARRLAILEMREPQEKKFAHRGCAAFLGKLVVRNCIKMREAANVLSKAA